MRLFPTPSYTFTYLPTYRVIFHSFIRVIVCMYRHALKLAQGQERKQTALPTPLNAVSNSHLYRTPSPLRTIQTPQSASHATSAGSVWHHAAYRSNNAKKMKQKVTRFVKIIHLHLPPVVDIGIASCRSGCCCCCWHAGGSSI